MKQAENAVASLQACKLSLPDPENSVPGAYLNHSTSNSDHQLAFRELQFQQEAYSLVYAYVLSSGLLTSDSLNTILFAFLISTQTRRQIQYISWDNCAVPIWFYRLTVMCVRADSYYSPHCPSEWTYCYSYTDVSYEFLVPGFYVVMNIFSSGSEI